jgi:hypothetical protein
MAPVWLVSDGLKAVMMGAGVEVTRVMVALRSASHTAASLVSLQ